MPSSNFPSEKDLLLATLIDAQQRFPSLLIHLQEAALVANRKDDGRLLHEAWMGSLHLAFTHAYKSDSRKITVFSKALKKQLGTPATATPFGRGEYGFDLAVVELRADKAPYGKAGGEPLPVNVVARFLWQVESEISNSATKLSEDLGKLIGGAAPCKLLVTHNPTQSDGGAEWRRFIGEAGQFVPGQLFVATVQSYATKQGGKTWRQGAPEIRVYRHSEHSALELIACLGAPVVEPIG